jgi:adenylate cyclase
MRSLGAFQFVGKTEAIPVYEVLARRETATDQQLELCEAFEAGMASYQAASWTQAAGRFQAILDAFPDDGPSRFYLDRCRRAISDPEQGREPGVIRMDVK